MIQGILADLATINTGDNRHRRAILSPMWWGLSWVDWVLLIFCGSLFGWALSALRER